MSAVPVDTNPLLAAALSAADAGLAVIYQQGKRAVAPGWNKGPALSPDALRAGFRPGLNVAFRAGPTSRVGGDAVVVLDVDLRTEDAADHAEARAAYAELVGDLKPTARTGGGGAHLYLRMADDLLPTQPATVLRQSEKRGVGEGGKPGKPAWTIELLAAEHAVTMPPSIHPSGEPYRWTGDGLADVPRAPDSLLRALPRVGLAKNTGDTGDAGDAAPGLSLSRPHDSPDSGDAGDTLPEGVQVIGKRKTAEGLPLPYFVLAMHKAGKFSAPGVYYIGQAIEGKEKAVVGHLAPQWLCSPLYVAAKTRDTAQSDWGRLLEFVDADGHLHRWAMPCELLAGNGEEVRRALLREGVTLTTNRALRPLLETYLQTARANLHARCVTRTGWHGDAFVLPRQTFGDTPAEPVLFQAASLDSVALSVSGELADWRANVAEPCAGNSRLVLAVSMAFAGPCLGLLHAEGGGVHLRGASSAGKSTALHVAASVYGLPEKYGKTWRATDNGLEGTAALHSDMLLILDEMGQLEPKHAGQVAYLLANGAGKARSNRDGTPRAVTTWRVLFLSAGEVGLDSLVKEGGGRVQAGQQVRVVDVPADAGAGLGLFDTVPDGLAPGAFADGLKSAAAKYHGAALPAFLEALAGEPGKYREAMRELRADIASRLVSAVEPGQVRRVADRFALIAAAGELATALSLTGWDTGEAERAAAACFRAWQDARGTAGNAEPAAMLRQVRAFLEAHGEARFTRWDATDEGMRTINRAGYRRAGQGGPTYYIETGAFRDEVCRGFDARAVAKVLAEAGALDTGGDGRDTRKMLLPDGRRARVYVVLPTLWGDEP